MAEDEKKKKEIRDTDDAYDNEEVEEMMDNDELDPEEAGFMEGYNQKPSKDPKKPKDIIQDDK
ncbi:MAG: hypothetical protein NUV67_03870 [archaeon]|nr:hypothetical protein [archaeon]